MNAPVIQPDNVEQLLKPIQKKFSNTARGKEVKFREECQYAKDVVLKNSTLRQCSPASLQEAIYNVAMVGLSLNPVNAYAYLTPRKIKVAKDQYEWQVVMIPGYRGLIKLANDSGAVSHVQAAVVYEGDTFDFSLGTDPYLHHKPNPFIPKSKKVRQGVYCVTTLTNGEKMITFMSPDDIEEVKACSDGADSSYSPWVRFEDEMWCKSCIRRASKTWPKSVHTPEMDHALGILNQHEGIRTQRPHRNVETITDEQVKQLECIPGDFNLPVTEVVRKILRAENVSTLEEVPADRFETIQQRVTQYCEKKAGEQ